MTADEMARYLERAVERLGWQGFLVAFGLSLVLFIVSFYPPMTVTVHLGNVGDVTDALGTLWRATTGIASLLSLVLAAYDLHRRDSTRSDDEPSGPDTEITIDGGEGDINVSLVFGDDSRVRVRNTGDDPPEEQTLEPREATDDGER